jgi:Cu(I)/Ag(I) efflux system protein CusF
MKILHKVVLAALIGVSSVATSSIAFAQQPAASATQDSMSDGEVKKVDKEAGKLTIKHGELKNLGMPGMTMVFKVKDPALLEKVKPGDKIRFVADKVGGALTVTSLQAAT